MEEKPNNPVSGFLMESDGFASSRELSTTRAGRLLQWNRDGLVRAFNLAGNSFSINRITLRIEFPDTATTIWVGDGKLDIPVNEGVEELARLMPSLDDVERNELFDLLVGLLRNNGFQEVAGAPVAEF